MVSPLDSATSRPSSGVASPPQRMPSRSRTQSISSDRPSTVAHSLMSPPLSVSPEPAFIAASAASQIVTNDHDSHAETWYDQHGIEPSGETAAVSPSALQLVNNFLDQLLFNFLALSRTTTLSALRPAVSEVLKPKLAKDAMNQADEELREYLGGDDEENAQAQCQPRDAASPTDWDLELAWKRTRLRCMVYSSLGDMEEEDEDYYMEQGHLDAGLEDRFTETVSPAVAIFLTSILEFMGEQALIVAGQAAYHRLRLKYEKELKEGARSPTGIADRILIEDLDMERVALDRTLGRLWRSWKKKIRSPAMGSMDRLTRSYSRDSMHSATGHMRSPSSAAEFAVPATVPEPDAEAEHGKGDTLDEEETLQEPAEEYLVAAGIPLPLGPNDVAEIEVPGLALDSDEEPDENDAADHGGPARPKSMIVLPLAEPPATPLPTPSEPRCLFGRRASSLPPPPRSRYVTPTEAQQALLGEEDRSEEAVTVEGTGSAESTEAAGIALGAPDVPRDPAGPESLAVTAETDAAPHEPVSEGDDMKEDVDDEVSIEEPRIVRSSRVSILGRSSSPASSDYGRPASINTNLPVRTPSIHSARLIDVASPRTPVGGSRRNSVVVAESARHSSPARTSRTVTPPVPEDRPGQSADSASSGSRPSVNPGNKSSLAASVSIYDTQDAAGTNLAITPTTPAAAAPAAAPATQPGAALPAVQEGVAKERHEAPGVASQDDTPGPSTPPKPVTKVTLLPATSSPASTTSTASSTFFIDTMPVLTEGREVQGRTESHRYHSPSSVQVPAVPERNVGRQAVANTSALRQPATIGQVSVERSRPRSPSEGSSSRPREPSAGRNRQQHASGSPSSTKLKAVRTSEEGMQGRIDVVRNFEELIHSDQTIQYTLTPESMRDLDPPSQSARSVVAVSPVVSVKTRKSEETRQNGSLSRSSSVPRNDSRTPAAAPRSSGSGSHSITDAHHSTRSHSMNTSKHGGVVPRSIPPMPSKPRATNGPQARDPRLARESLAEFSEFIRSTGPAGGSVGPANAFSGTERIQNPASVSHVSIETGHMSTTSYNNQPRLQARGAAVDYKDDNSDLIDFIRRGPPSGQANPRIPRAVAPFRSTMDSDQLAGAVGGRAVDAQLRDTDFRSSRTSTNATESSVPPSIQSSINSHSALLARTKPMSYDAADGDMPIPKRKTRRIRDPYAIDLSDEDLDDDDLAPMPVPKKKPQTQEESLIDFLNNYPPPGETTVQPFDIAQTRDSLKPKKKASAPSLMARLTRRDSSHSGGSRSNRPSSPKVSDPRRLSSRASSGKAGHIPIQVSVAGKVPSPDRTSSKAAAMMGGGPPRGGRVPMKKFEPREAVSVPSRETSDLAEFFKHSAPPPGATLMANQFPGQAGREEANGITKVFSRRKKPSIS
ncbi:hypothetical protein C8A05DRAFT_19158 [Staphylotrichum tortipilum]|uniref:Uncharacterized protein n=1 Tax=Staphylotrichum tortipilum TaxID=2831512 RepID=A0AAN6ME03_9PEZI|nr:hypothetical protein C8A05DRAFT_19158 [Staphylotrichum longicolle]